MHACAYAPTQPLLIVLEPLQFRPIKISLDAGKRCGDLVPPFPVLVRCFH
jgi:hypothetical protein